MENYDFFHKFADYTKERIKKIILFSLIGYYLLFLYFYNFYRMFNLSIQLSWLNGLLAALVTAFIYFVLLDFIGFLSKTEIIKVKITTNLNLVLVGVYLLLFAGIVGIYNLDIRVITLLNPYVVLTFLMPIVLSVVSLLGVVLILFRKKYGINIIFISGLIAVIGSFIPIFTDLYLPLVLTLAYFDPILILFGANIGIIRKIKEKGKIQLRIFTFLLIEIVCLIYYFIISYFANYLIMVGIPIALAELFVRIVLIIAVISCVFLLSHLIHYLNMGSIVSD